MKRVSDEARKEARFWLAIFVIIDGGLNLAETMSAVPAGVTTWQYGGAIVYGVFPTLAALGLGRLQAYIERIPSAPGGKHWFDKLMDWVQAGKQAKPVARKMSKQDEQGSKVAGKTDKQEPTLQVQEEQVAGASDKQASPVAPAIAGKADKQEKPLQGQESKQPVQVEALLAYWRDNPKASDQQVADKFGVKRQAIQQRRAELVRKGDIRMTDKGVEIVGTPVALSEVKSS